MRLTKTQTSNAVTKTLSKQRMSTETTESSKAAKSAVTADVIKKPPFRSAALERTIHKISSRSKPTSFSKILSTQAQSISGAQLKVGAEARPYLRLFLAGVALDKNHK